MTSISAAATALDRSVSEADSVAAIPNFILSLLEIRPSQKTRLLLILNYPGLSKARKGLQSRERPVFIFRILKILKSLRFLQASLSGCSAAGEPLLWVRLQLRGIPACPGPLLLRGLKSNFRHVTIRSLTCHWATIEVALTVVAAQLS